ncbi:MAG: hypothetical protein ACKVZJ_05340 [Phycisphaerales bacterium]
MNENNRTPTVREGSALSNAALWASAFVILALILVEASRRGHHNAALAGDASSVDDLTVLTAASGTDEDVLCVLDQRNESLSVFAVEQGRSIQLLQVQDLRQAFLQARLNAGAGAGGGR